MIEIFNDRPAYKVSFYNSQETLTTRFATFDFQRDKKTENGYEVWLLFYNVHYSGR